MVKEWATSRVVIYLVWMVNFALINAAEGIFATSIALMLGFQNGSLGRTIGGVGLLNSFSPGMRRTAA